MKLRITSSLGALLTALNLPAANWPQFRGTDAAALGTGKPPVHFGPKTNLVWRTAVPTGHSSPVIWGDRIFLTGLEQGRLETLCLDRRDGKILWRQAAPAEKLEPSHRIGSPASPTPCTDGERIYVYFGSFGLLAYDFAGAEKWRHPLPVPIVEFGSGSSPILAGENVIQLCDQDVDSFLIAVNRRTGRVTWKVTRPEFRRGFATPFLWRHEGGEEIVVPGAIKVSSYAASDGQLLWTARGMARVANASPTAGDGLLFLASWNIGGDAGDRLMPPARTEFFTQNDANKDDVLTKEEFPAGPYRDRYSQFDLNKDGGVTKSEYDGMADQFAQAENAIFAIKPGGRGDITDTHVVWKHNRSLPYVSSPIFHQGRVYSVRSGGMATCYDARTGEVAYRDERLEAPGDFYASAVAADGHIYFVSQRGTVTVLTASSGFEVVARNEMGEPVFATPAVLDGRIYLRTEKQLLVFGR